MERFEETIEQFEIMYKGLSATGPDAEALSFLGYAHGVAGNRDKALEVLDQLMELRKRRYVQPQNLATVYVGLGEVDSAFEWLDKAFVDRCGPLSYIKVWPNFDRLRSDPRMDELIERLGLPL